MIKLKYIETPLEESVYDYSQEDKDCFFCGKTKSPILELDGSLDIISDKNIDDAKTVCLKCLYNKTYGFEQQVEYGLLTEQGLQLESDKNPDSKASDYYKSYISPIENQLLNMESSKFIELRHTPPFRAWQGAKWLVHCNDFMKFIGVWEHEDFVKHAPDNNAKGFYENICLYGGDGLYKDQFGPNKSEYASCTFYAFECITCKQKKGYIDNG